MLTPRAARTLHAARMTAITTPRVRLYVSPRISWYGGATECALAFVILSGPTGSGKFGVQNADKRLEMGVELT